MLRMDGIQLRLQSTVWSQNECLQNDSLQDKIFCDRIKTCKGTMGGEKA